MTKSLSEVGHELKKDLILKDFESYIDGITRHQERVISLRQWEVTLLVASYGFALGQGLVSSILPIAAAILIMFALMEVVVRGRIRRREGLLSDVVETFSGKDNLVDLLSDYTFEHTRWCRITFKDKIASIRLSMFTPEYLVWNFSLGIVSFIVYLFLK